MSHKIRSNHKLLWAFVLTSAAGFMVTLDNLVVTTALPVIRHDLGAGLGGLEWTVNAYTLTFAVLLLTGAALGDRFGRRRMLAIGLAIFTVSSAAAALAPSIGALDVARAVPGHRRRDRDAADADDPLGRRPGRAARPRARRLGRDHRPRRRLRPARRRRRRLRHLVALDLLAERADRARPRPARPAPPRREPRPVGPPRPARASCSPASACSGSSGGSCAATRSAGARPRSSARSLGGLVVIALLRRLGAARARRRCCRCASSATAPSRSRTPRRSSSRSGCSARSSCSPSSSRRCRATRRSARACGSCPWTAMPMIVAPIAGALSDRIGGHRLMAAGLALQAIGLAWIAAISTPTTAVRRHRAPVQRLGDRDGALLRPGRERRALDGPLRGAGAGLGRQQRDPRARRSPRRRGARLDLRPLRRLPHRRHLRRRDGREPSTSAPRSSRSAGSPRSSSARCGLAGPSGQSSSASSKRRPSAPRERSGHGGRSRLRAPASRRPAGQRQWAGWPRNRPAEVAACSCSEQGRRSSGCSRRRGRTGSGRPSATATPRRPGSRFADRRCIVSIDDEPAIERLASALPLGGADRARHRPAGRGRRPGGREARARRIRSRPATAIARDEQAPPARGARGGGRAPAALAGRRSGDGELELPLPLVVKAADRTGRARPLARPPSLRSFGPRSRSRAAASRSGDRARRGVRRRARGDGDRLLGRRRVRAARRHRPHLGRGARRSAVAARPALALVRMPRRRSR